MVSSSSVISMIWMIKENELSLSHIQMEATFCFIYNSHQYEDLDNISLP